MGRNTDLISIIIPCYNQGSYLLEAIESAVAQTYSNIEIVVVNDGSTDSYTNKLISELSGPNVLVVETDNQGLAAARNNGIRACHGEYILPLDGDDKIAPEYCAEAIEILRANAKVGIVNCETQYFEKRSDIRSDPEYTLETMLTRNIILCCAMFRKSDWEKVGGYNPNMVYGGEDWDFWISIIETGLIPYKIPEIRFFYRIRHGSMARSIDDIKFRKLREQVFKNHLSFYAENFQDPITLLIENQMLRKEIVKYKKSRIIRIAKNIKSRLRFL